MKKLNKSEIQKLFEDVTERWFSYNDGLGTIKLDGSFCSDELREIAKVLDGVNKQVREAEFEETT